MPREKRSPDEVKRVKDEILVQAQQIISQEGLEALSMRKLAGQLHITSTTIYNYYRNKDELCLLILTKAFEDLYQVCLAACQSNPEPEERIYAMARAYVDFGVRQPSLYGLMFASTGPQYQDFQGTELEAPAQEELRISRLIGRLFIDTLLEFPKRRSSLTDEDLEFQITYYWCLLHGYVSSYNNILEYIHPDPSSIQEQMLRQMIKTVRRAIEE
jgi:AcrR family transcriptional regulator